MKDKYAIERAQFPYLHYVIRPIGRKVLPCAMQWGLTPNQVTIASITILFISLALFGVGGLWPRIMGAIMINVALVLDCLDGELARKTGQSSKRGEYLDAIGGYLSAGLLFSTIGLGLALATDASYEILNGLIAPGIYLSIGLWAGVAALLTRVINLRHQFLFGDSLRDNQKRILQAASWFESFLFPLLIVAAVTDCLGFVVFLYGFFYLAKFLYALGKALKG